MKNPKALHVWQPILTVANINRRPSLLHKPPFIASVQVYVAAIMHVGRLCAICGLRVATDLHLQNLQGGAKVGLEEVVEDLRLCRLGVVWEQNLGSTTEQQLRTKLKRGWLNLGAKTESHQCIKVALVAPPPLKPPIPSKVFPKVVRSTFNLQAGRGRTHFLLHTSFWLAVLRNNFRSFQTALRQSREETPVKLGEAFLFFDAMTLACENLKALRSPGQPARIVRSKPSGYRMRLCPS